MTAGHAFWETALALSVSFILGAIIGLERQYRQRTAGLRTNVLVAVGAAAFVDLGVRMGGNDGSVRVIAYVVSGIGFLGAGVIMKDGGQVRGLNTAATLWSTAAVGAFSGCGLTGEATLVALFILAGNTLLRPLVEFIDRRPLNPETTEALYRMHVICHPENVSAARDLLADELEHHHYPIQDIETLSEGDDYIELAALLVPTSADPKELDIVSEHIARSPDVISATWSVSTTN
ncbi:MgtC/SapB family protein [Komagataeibacter swingsii]|uniref:Protein MgtC n=1 Tax=Komagataeibacter swingsii TaxID=215220 RepID=A0A850NX54_9PROT|nr:MgtC/SapB family protein [Komagataeibacter swingsii]AHI26293.1 Mg2+ transporter-C family protein [Komagataeibacter xylinus E25]NVN35523.1 MgtC/SapB family protein [Komagataeibacter swingsii]RFP02333.1 methyltransferase [Komagataeibacter xylinus]RFP03231.1 methyltransferase [Komagataeibacter xylinus]